jgi:hypothetical protein
VGINLDAALAWLGPASIAVSIVRPDGGLASFGRMAVCSLLASGQCLAETSQRGPPPRPI